MKGYRTYITLGVAMVAAVLKLLGYESDNSSVQTILEGVVVFALPIAAYFRSKA